MASTVYVPAARAAVIAAAPLFSAAGGPKLTPLMMNCTAPPAGPTPGAKTFTAAVNVTEVPKTEGLAEVVTDVLVAACTTDSATPPEVAPVKLTSPE